MKLFILNILLLMSILFTASCTDVVRKNDPGKPYAIDTSLLTPVNQAKADISSFDSFSQQCSDKTYGIDSVPIKAFTVRAADLLTALGISNEVQPRYENIRVYLGYNKESSAFKLYIVPVSHGNISDTLAGQDIFIDKNGNPVQPDIGYVLDLNAPCPNLCDVHSALIETPRR